MFLTLSITVPMCSFFRLTKAPYISCAVHCGEIIFIDSVLNNNGTLLRIYTYMYICACFPTSPVWADFMLRTNKELAHGICFNQRTTYQCEKSSQCASASNMHPFPFPSIFNCHFWLQKTHDSDCWNQTPCTNLWRNGEYFLSIRLQINNVELNRCVNPKFSFFLLFKSFFIKSFAVSSLGKSWLRTGMHFVSLWLNN